MAYFPYKSAEEAPEEVDVRTQVRYVNTTDAKNWSEVRLITAAKSQAAPGVADFNNTLYCAFRGEGSETQLYYTTTSDGKQWSSPASIGSCRSQEEPAMAVLNKTLYCVFKGATDSQFYYTTTSDG